jgi:NAD(P)-dependent dehydrogenase (short-subunit alcohol dehydrogenase family)
LARLFVITGTSRGLGYHLARELESLGQRVVGCSTTAAPPHRVDVSHYSEVEAWAHHVHSLYGPADVLINNAGITSSPNPLWEQHPDEVQKLLRVNVAGVHHGVRAFLPAMLGRGSGVVVNISSDWGRTAAPMVAPYCATKWAVEGLTRSLALELPAGLAAVSLDPGTIDTDMLRFTFGPGSSDYPPPESWRQAAARLIMSLGPQHNGQALTLPQPESGKG